MGMDLDAVFAAQKIEELEQILSDMDHGDKSDICDEIEDFVDKMKIKYGEEN